MYCIIRGFYVSQTLLPLITPSTQGYQGQVYKVNNLDVKRKCLPTGPQISNMKAEPCLYQKVLAQSEINLNVVTFLQSFTMSLRNLKRNIKDTNLDSQLCHIKYLYSKHNSAIVS